MKECKGREIALFTDDESDFFDQKNRVSSYYNRQLCKGYKMDLQIVQKDRSFCK